jgi:hypothetical protein
MSSRLLSLLLADTRCKVCAAVSSLDEAEQFEWHGALNDKRVTHAAVVRLLRSEYAVDVDEASVRRHRQNHE